jgi:hypothetical protein
MFEIWGGIQICAVNGLCATLTHETAHCRRITAVAAYASLEDVHFDDANFQKGLEF